MRIYIEGYDINNCGDVLMATASAILAAELRPRAEIVFPRALPFQPEHYRSIVGQLNHRIAAESGGFWPVLRAKPAAWAISPAACQARPGDAILFCNGFIFGDDWRKTWIAHLAAQMKRLRARGVPIVLMPQSFGPFTDQQKAKHVREAVEATALACARDRRSLQHLEALCGKDSRRIGSIDYTGILNAVPAFRAGARRNRLCIIPNVKIGAKYGPEAEASYVAQLAEVGRLAKTVYAMDVRVVVHTKGKDDALAGVIAGACEAGDIVRGDPLEIRRFIGQSRAMVSSRFHGLKNALAQNVPALSLGWSHKYTELMRAYGVSAFSVDLASGQSVAAGFQHLISEEQAIGAALFAANANIERTFYAGLRTELGSVLGRPKKAAKPPERHMGQFLAGFLERRPTRRKQAAE